MNYFIEAVIIGIVLIIVGLSLNWLIQTYIRGKEPTMSDCIWLGLILFLSAFIVHVLFQWLGINSWYCKHGDACLRISS